MTYLYIPHYCRGADFTALVPRNFPTTIRVAASKAYCATMRREQISLTPAAGFFNFHGMELSLTFRPFYRFHLTEVWHSSLHKTWGCMSRISFRWSSNINMSKARTLDMPRGACKHESP